MKHGSLFSGIGGFDLAAEWMGWENVFHCEWMEFPRKVLDYHFPDADSHIDICKTDFTKYANKIDILTGGFPCQPFSLAGKRKGTDDERYLWGEMLRAIQEIKPKYVIAENVYGITSIDGGLVFQQVCLDLENEGYEVQPFIIPACAKNAPHRRDRCWFIAYGNKRNREEVGFQTRGEKHLDRVEGKQYPTNTKCEGLEGYYREREGCTEHRSDKRLFIGTETQFITTNPECSGGIQISKDIQSKKSNGFQFIRNGRKRDAINSECIGWTAIRYDNGEFEKTQQAECRKQQFGRADSTQSWWRDFPTQPPVCGGDDGIPTQLDGITFPRWRSESIKGYGNAIVPQIAYQLFEIIQELNENN
jgi:DNA (cytosine-5)-methyltransferase 1